MAAAVAGAMGISALGAVAQYYQAEKARKANQKQLDEIKKMFEAIKPPEYDVSVIDPPEYITEAVPEPAINYSALSPEQFKKLRDFNPQVAEYVAEKDPTLVEKTAVGKEGRQAQLEALRGMIERAKSTGPDPLLKGQMDMASERGQRDAQSRQQSILQDAQRRGQSGSGLMFAAQLSGAEDAMQREAALQREAAMEAYRSKIDAMRDSASLGGQISEQDFSEQGRNADIINDFNMRTSRNANEYNRYRSGLLNDAQKYNLGVEQSAADRNVDNANKFAMYNRDMANNALTDQYNRRVQERGFQNNVRDAQYRNKVGQQDRTNDMKSRQYNDQLGRAENMAGLGRSQMQMNSQTAADRNRLYQGLADAGSAGMMNYQQQSNVTADRDQRVLDSKQSQANANRDYELRKREMELKYGSKG
jgi:hypothetical protein